MTPQEFVEMVARMSHEDEMEGGYVMEDAFATLNDLIATARAIEGQS